MQKWGRTGAQPHDLCALRRLCYAGAMPTFTFTLPDGPGHAAFAAKLARKVQEHLDASRWYSVRAATYDVALQSMPERLSLSEVAAHVGAPLENLSDKYHLGRRLRKAGWRPVRARKGATFYDAWVRWT